MLLYPTAQWDPLGKQTEPAMKAHDFACVHTMAGYFDGTDAMFHREGYGGLESHFGLRHDGFMKQWQDCMFEADANFNGNWHVVSLETQDKGGPFPVWVKAEDIPPWTPAQFEAIVKWLLWITDIRTHANCPSTWKCRGSGIPLALVPDTKPGRRGCAYHRQGIDPWRVDGGEQWSAGSGKPCPGNARVQQYGHAITEAQRRTRPPIELLGDTMFMFRNREKASPTWFCDAGKKVGLNESTDVPTFTNQGVVTFQLDDDTYQKFINTYPGS